MIKMTLNDLKLAPSDDELRELEAAESKEPVFDEDSPAMTVEQLIQFKRMHRDHREMSG